MSESIKTHCNSCGQETNHSTLFEHLVVEEHEEIEHISKERYMVVQCLGCETVSYLTEDKYTDVAQQPEDEWMVIYTNYPESVYENPEFPILSYEKYDLFPSTVYELYLEIEAAFKSDSLILAALGLRTLVEAICIQQKIEGRNLMEKIKAMESKGLVSKNELPILDKLRHLGNASAHEIKRFSSEQLGYALEIVNHVLISIYILPRINRKFRAK